MLAFTTICFVVCHIVENIGVVTGFPFGAYYFTDVMGPKLFRVPFTMGLAYLAIGYSCWTLALVIVNRPQNKLSGRTVLAVPLLAACIMLVWDVCSEPQWSTISHFWIWPHGGPYFGAPRSNFAGWFLTDFVIFQAWTFYLVKRRSVLAFVPSTHWRLAWLSYLVVILANIMNAIALFRLPPVYDPAGTRWNASSIALNVISTSVFLMGAFALLAWKKLFGKSPVYEKAQS
jgi:putative membrane protein